MFNLSKFTKWQYFSLNILSENSCHTSDLLRVGNSYSSQLEINHVIQQPTPKSLNKCRPPFFVGVREEENILPIVGDKGNLVLWIAPALFYHLKVKHLQSIIDLLLAKQVLSKWASSLLCLLFSLSLTRLLDKRTKIMKDHSNKHLSPDFRLWLRKDQL